MGKLVSLKNARKRRDKKYDPYKLAKKQLMKGYEEVEKSLSEAIEKDEDGAIKLDEAGKPIFKDVIEWETNSAQIRAIWMCIKAVLEERVVPPNEVDAAFDLMAIIAKMERDTTKDYKTSLPINYFVGTWHILNSCRMFHLFEKDPALDKAIDGLTIDFARRIDMYHEVKRRETVEEKIKPENILSLPNKEYYNNSNIPKLSLESGNNANEKEDN